MSDPSESRREQALRFGATHVLDPTVDDVAARTLELTGSVVAEVYQQAGARQVGKERGHALRAGAPVLEDAVRRLGGGERAVRPDFAVDPFRQRGDGRTVSRLGSDRRCLRSNARRHRTQLCRGV